MATTVIVRAARQMSTNEIYQQLDENWERVPWRGSCLRTALRFAWAGATALSTRGTKDKKCICCRCLFLNIHNKFLCPRPRPGSGSGSGYGSDSDSDSQLRLPAQQQKQMLPPGYTGLYYFLLGLLLHSSLHRVEM